MAQTPALILQGVPTDSIEGLQQHLADITPHAAMHEKTRSLHETSFMLALERPTHRALHETLWQRYLVEGKELERVVRRRGGVIENADRPPRGGPMDPHPIAHVTPAPRGHREDTRVPESPDAALGGYRHVHGERCEIFGVCARVDARGELKG